MPALHSLNGSETHAIDVQFKAVLCHIIAVVALGFIALQELTTAIDTDVMKVCLGGHHF